MSSHDAVPWGMLLNARETPLKSSNTSMAPASLPSMRRWYRMDAPSALDGAQLVGVSPCEYVEYCHGLTPSVANKESC